MLSLCSGIARVPSSSKSLWFSETQVSGDPNSQSILKHYMSSKGKSLCFFVFEVSFELWNINTYSGTKEGKYISSSQGIRWKSVSITLHGMIIFTRCLTKGYFCALSFEVEIFGADKPVGPQEDLFMIRAKYFLGGMVSG